MEQREGGGEEPLRALAEALAILGDRWSLLVVADLLPGPRTFAQLRRDLPQIAPSVLGERLRRLEAAGAVVPEPYSARPPRSRYRLADRGRRLRPVVSLLADWGGPGSGPSGPPHADCGTPLELGWHCPRCGVPVQPEEAEADGDLYA